MVRSNILWATGLFACSLFFGTCSFFEYFPGESIGINLFNDMSEKFGAIETGFGTIVIGTIFAVWTLLSRSEGATDIGLSGDGGDGGD